MIQIKQTQKDIVLDVMYKFGTARTEEIKIKAMERGVSCADRYLRWLREEGRIKNIGKYKKGDRTDTWEYIN